MSVRYSAMAAEYVGWEVLGEGEIIGEDQVRTGKVALTFAADEVFYIEGYPDDIRAILLGALASLNARVS